MSRLFSTNLLDIKYYYLNDIINHYQMPRTPVRPCPMVRPPGPRRGQTLTSPSKRRGAGGAPSPAASGSRTRRAQRPFARREQQVASKPAALCRSVDGQTAQTAQTEYRHFVAAEVSGRRERDAGALDGPRVDRAESENTTWIRSGSGSAAPAPSRPSPTSAGSAGTAPRARGRRRRPARAGCRRDSSQGAARATHARPRAMSGCPSPGARRGCARSPRP